MQKPTINVKIDGIHLEECYSKDVKYLLVYSNLDRYEYDLKELVPIRSEKKKMKSFKIKNDFFEIKHNYNIKKEDIKNISLIFVILGKEYSSNAGPILSGRHTFSEILLNENVHIFSIVDVYKNDAGIKGMPVSEYEDVSMPNSRKSMLRNILLNTGNEILTSSYIECSISLSSFENKNGLNIEKCPKWIDFDHDDLIKKWNNPIEEFKKKGYSFYNSSLEKITWAHQYLGHMLLGDVSKTFLAEINKVKISSEFLSDILYASAIIIYSAYSKDEIKYENIKKRLYEEKDKKRLYNWITLACTLPGKLIPYRIDRRYSKFDSKIINIEDMNCLFWQANSDCEELQKSAREMLQCIIESPKIYDQLDIENKSVIETPYGTMEINKRELIGKAHSLCSQWRSGSCLVTIKETLKNGSNIDMAHATCMIETKDESIPYLLMDGIEYVSMVNESENFESSNNIKQRALDGFVSEKLDSDNLRIPYKIDDKDSYIGDMIIYRWMTQSGDYVLSYEDKKIIGVKFMDIYKNRIKDLKIKFSEINKNQETGNISWKLPMKSLSIPEYKFKISSVSQDKKIKETGLAIFINKDENMKFYESRNPFMLWELNEYFCAKVLFL